MKNHKHNQIKNKTLFHYFEKYMFFMGIFGQFGNFIQAAHVYSVKSAQSLSLPANLLIFTSLSSWLIYGLLIKNKVLIASNIIGVIGSALVLLSIFIYP